VSTDNFQTFDEYDLNKYSINQPSRNAEFSSVNISKTLANLDTAYLRFYVLGMSHYYWMIDDVALVEGDQGVEIESINFFKPQLVKGPFPLISPVNYLRDIGFEATVRNVTGISLAGVNLNIVVNHSQNSNGSTGAGLVYGTNRIANNNGSLIPFASDTLFSNAPFFTPSLQGEYQAIASVSSSQFPRTDSAELSFTVSDTVFGKDLNSPSGIIGTQQFSVWSLVNGDKLGTLYYIDSTISNVQLSSVSFYVSNDPVNIGSVIRPVFWEYSSALAYATGRIDTAFGSELATSLIPYTVSSVDTNQWITLSLDTGIALLRTSNVGEFVVGWEVVGGAPTGSSFSVWNDDEAEKIAPPVSNFMSLAHLPQQPNWMWTQAAPMIRLNVKPLLVGEEEVDLNRLQLKVYPNPSNGSFTIQCSASTQLVEVYNVNGQKVQVELFNNKLDLTNQPKGIYLLRVQLENGEVVSKKLMKN
jgi:hypothetical protein